MTHVSDEPAPVPPGPSAAAAGAARPPEHPALTAYRAKTRRQLTIYGVVIALLVVIGFVAVRLAYAHGDLNKVSNSVGAAPATITPAQPADRLTLRWSNPEQPAIGRPYDNGIVVTWSGHTVNGRDAVTGAVRWHYTRSNVVLCSVVQQDGTTIATYKRGANCDQVTGFTTATGQPKWYRTMTDDGPVSVSSAPNVVLIVAATSVHVIDNGGGLDRWDWAAPSGCTVDRAKSGGAGVLISYHCGAEHRLLLRDQFNDTNKWTIVTGNEQVPVATSALIAAADPRTGVVTIYSADKGTPLGTVALFTTASTRSALANLPRSSTAINYFDAQNRALEFVQAGDLTAFRGAVKSTPAQAIWTVAGSAPAVLDSFNQLVIVEQSAVVIRAVSTGVASRSITLASAPTVAGTNPRAYTVGSGFLIAGTGVALYS